TGSTSNVFFNLGPAHTLRDTPNPGTLLVNLNTELTAAFGEDWATRNDLYFGIIANRNNAPASGLGSAPAENGDPSRTIYASKGTGSANSTTPWSFTSSALGVSATAIGGFMEAIDNITANGNNVMLLTQGANSVEWNNSWSQWNPVPGGAFSIFNGGIQRAFASAPGASQVKMLDIHRVPGDGTASSYVSTVYLSDGGDLWVGRLYYQLTTAVAPASAGTVTGAGLYPQNAAPQLAATPASGYAFINWTGTATSTSNPLSVTMDGAKSFTANFGVLPSINAPTFTSVTASGATLGATVTSLGDGTLVERGVVHSSAGTNEDPAIGGTGVTKTTTGGGLGTFTTGVTGLTAATTYAFKGFVTTSTGTAYTAARFFTTDTTVSSSGGIGTVSNRPIRSGDSQLFKFNLAEGRAVTFSGSGATSQMQWELRDGSNNLLGSGTGNLAFSGALTSGEYRIRISNTGVPTQTFSLNLNASSVAKPKPDVAGGLFSATTGSNVYSPTPQAVVASSKKAAPVTLLFAIDNDGPLSDSMRVSGTGSAADGSFAISYTSPTAGNVTAGVIAGTYTTPVITESGAAVPLSAQITPNKNSKSIVKKVKRGKKTITTYLKKTFPGSVTARASSDTTLSDTVNFSVTTTP
ncbi:MAG: hypothetical protein KGR69_12550, partial [Verrucomicrobia bacterium]|nr:hypothetical protein [Verrucomicrobiota bacterium]